MQTRKDLLDSLDFAGPAAQLVAAVTAPSRHDARVAATLAAALVAADQVAASQGCSRDQALSALLAADLAQAGGPRGLGGRCGGTSRCPWAAGLGKGRWQATDGGAYYAALRGAISHRYDADSHQMAAWGVDLDDRFVTPASVAACLAAGAISWGHAYALVGRLVLRAVGVAYDDLDDDLRQWAPTMDGPDSPATWAAAFHALMPQVDRSSSSW